MKKHGEELRKGAQTGGGTTRSKDQSHGELQDPGEGFQVQSSRGRRPQVFADCMGRCCVGIVTELCNKATSIVSMAKNCWQWDEAATTEQAACRTR